MAHPEDFGKETYFEKIGYVWDARIEAYVTKAEWQMFSKKYIDDHSLRSLLRPFNMRPGNGFCGHHSHQVLGLKPGV